MVLIFDLSSGSSTILSIFVPSRVSCVRFSPNSSNPVIVSAGWDKVVKVRVNFQTCIFPNSSFPDDVIVYICYFRGAIYPDETILNHQDL